MSEKQTCSCCVMDESVPSITFDEDGVCNLCHVQDKLSRTFAIEEDKTKQATFDKMIQEIKEEGRGKKYDCIVPISGGGDSSYALYKAVTLGLRPLAYHFDNGWSSEIARKNIKAVTEGLNVPLKILSYPWEDMREVYRATLKASIPEPCLPCLVGVFSLAYKASDEEGIRTVIFGSSPFTEGIAPLSWSYVDGKYLEDVVKKHGTSKALKIVKDFNRLRARHLSVNTLVKQTRIVMFPLYLDWDDNKIKETLNSKFGWGDGGKHADCMYTPFRNHVINKKFGFDLRRLGPSALIRSGRITRSKALAYFQTNPLVEDVKRTNYVLKRLGFTRKEYEEIMAAKPRTHRDFRSYAPLLSLMRPVVQLLTEKGMLSEHVYDKYYNC
jgi:N-acetyl sugar amidotransferase